MSECPLTWERHGILHRCILTEHKESEDKFLRFHRCGCGSEENEIIGLDDRLARQRAWHAEHDG